MAITQGDRQLGFNDKCETCQCYNCTVDYAKLVGAPAWTSTLCKYGYHLNCHGCREEGKNSQYHHYKDDIECPDFATDGEYC